MLRRQMLAAALVAAAAPAFGQAYPNKPITMIVPFAAGGPTDLLARIIGERMGKELGQQFIIENVTGAAGTIAMAKLARAAPDGYTIGIGHVGTNVANAVIYTKLGFDLVNDLEPIARLPANPMLVVAAEMIGAQYGIGAFVLQAGNLMQTDQLMAGVVMLSVLGLLIAWGLGMIERSVLRWR